MRIASVAAVVVILVGLGIYNRWFVNEPWMTSERSKTAAPSLEQPNAEAKMAESGAEARGDELRPPAARPDQTPRELRESIARQGGQEPQRDTIGAMKLQAPVSE